MSDDESESYFAKPPTLQELTHTGKEIGLNGGELHELMFIREQRASIGRNGFKGDNISGAYVKIGRPEKNGKAANGNSK